MLHNISRGRDRFEITVIRNPSFAVDDLQVSIRPDAPVSVAISGDVFTVTVFGEDRTSYIFSIQGLDANRTPIGIPISRGRYNFGNKFLPLCIFELIRLYEYSIEMFMQ